MKKVMLLASGGLDSTTLGYFLIREGYIIYPLFFDYGQHCVEKEWTTCKTVFARHQIEPHRISISDIFCGSTSRLISEANLWLDKIEADDLYVPYRTMLFFSVAAARAQTIGLQCVYSAFINSNHAKELDCTAEFLNSMDSLVSNLGSVKICLPFRNFTKAQVVELARDLAVPIGITFSCQVYSSNPCGVCPNCVERIEALSP